MSFIKQLEIFSFRNIKEVRLNIESSFLCLYGQNAQGKTNILESLYLLSNIRSFRLGLITDWLMHGNQKSQVKAMIEDDTGKYSLSYSMDKDKRVFHINGNRQKGIKDVLQNLKIISYSPSSFELITGNEGEKRRFFDKLAFCLDTAHLDDLVYYNKVLKNRNYSLKNKKDYEMWDDMLVKTGLKIFKRRKQASEYLSNYLQETFKTFFEEIKNIEINLSTNVLADEKDYLYKLKENKKIDEIRGFTSVGPQRDIFDVNINGMNAKKTMSTGQAKLLAFLFKIAKSRLINKHCKNKPIFLYDDASIFLDENRFLKLIEIIKKENIQIISTSVDKTLFSRLFSDTVQLINIDKGRVLNG